MTARKQTVLRRVLLAVPFLTLIAIPAVLPASAFAVRPAAPPTCPVAHPAPCGRFGPAAFHWMTTSSAAQVKLFKHPTSVTISFTWRNAADAPIFPAHNNVAAGNVVLLVFSGTGMTSVHAGTNIFAAPAGAVGVRIQVNGGGAFKAYMWGGVYPSHSAFHKPRLRFSAV